MLSILLPSLRVLAQIRRVSDCLVIYIYLNLLQNSRVSSCYVRQENSCEFSVTNYERSNWRKGSYARFMCTLPTNGNQVLQVVLPLEKYPFIEIAPIILIIIN